MDLLVSGPRASLWRDGKHLACIARRYAEARAGLGDYLKVACQGKSLECS